MKQIGVFARSSALPDDLHEFEGVCMCVCVVVKPLESQGIRGFVSPFFLSSFLDKEQGDGEDV